MHLKTKAQDQKRFSSLTLLQVKNPGTLPNGMKTGLMAQTGLTLPTTSKDGLVRSMTHGLGLITHPGMTGLGQTTLVVTSLKRLVAL